MTLQNKTIKQYPFKYDSFLNVETLKDYIKHYVSGKANLKIEWLDASDYSFQPPNNPELDFQHDLVNILEVTCYESKEYDEIFNKYNHKGELILNLNPNQYSKELLIQIISDIKNGN